MANVHSYALCLPPSFHPDQLAVPFSLIEAFGVGAADAALDRSAGVGIYYASPAASRRLLHPSLSNGCALHWRYHSLTQDRGCVGPRLRGMFSRAFWMSYSYLTRHCITLHR